MKEKLISFLKKSGVGLGLLILLFYGLTCAYYLPRTYKVKVQGTEVKRDDTKLKDGTVETRDVRYLMTTLPDGTPMTFRNEDTGWGWPPYFKFDSGDVTSMAATFSNQDPKPWVLVTTYGWRIDMMSWYPNAVSLEEVEATYEHFPLFNIIFLFLSLIGFIMLFLGLKKLSRWRPFSKSKEPGEPAGSQASQPAGSADGSSD